MAVHHRDCVIAFCLWPIPRKGLLRFQLTHLFLGNFLFLNRCIQWIMKWKTLLKQLKEVRKFLLAVIQDCPEPSDETTTSHALFRKNVCDFPKLNSDLVARDARSMRRFSRGFRGPRRIEKWYLWIPCQIGGVSSKLWLKRCDQNVAKSYANFSWMKKIYRGSCFTWKPKNGPASAKSFLDSEWSIPKSFLSNFLVAENAHGLWTKLQ